MIDKNVKERTLRVGSYINYVTESYLCNWIVIKLAGDYDNLNLMQLIATCHRDNIQAICDYIFEMYDGKTIYSSQHLNSIFNEAMVSLGFSREQFLQFENKNKELVLSQSL